MPTFTNSTSVDLYSGEPYIKFIANTTTVTDKYVNGLPVGVTLTSHEPTISPVVKFMDATEYPTAEFDITPYSKIWLFNSTDDAATVYFNDDSTNSFLLPVDDFWVLDMDFRYGCIKASSAGSGRLIMWGLKR